MLFRSWARATDAPSDKRSSDTAAIRIRICVPLKAELPGSGRCPAKQRPPDGGREDVVEIKMQLAENADAVATCPVDRELRLQPDLEIATDPDHTWINGAGGKKAVAKIVTGVDIWNSTIGIK